MSSRRSLVLFLVASVLAAALVFGVRLGADAAPIAGTISVSDAAVDEGASGAGGSMVFTVTVTGVTSGESVHYKTENGTASAGVDYIATEGDLTFPTAGSRTVTVPVIGDSLSEADETFLLKLSGNTFSDDTAVGTIRNDDFSLSVGNASVTEGNAGTVNAAVVIGISRARNLNTTVQYATSNGTATAGQDYVSSAATATIAAGQLSVTVNIGVNGDALYEDDESFLVTLSNPSSGVSIDDGSATVTIGNDDAQPPTDQLPKVSIANASTSEGDDGTLTGVFNVSLDKATARTVTVVATTSDGSAKAPGDYVAKTSTIVFDPSSGPQTKQFNVTINGDELDEANETFTATLSSPSAAALNDAAKTAAMTITDDDPAPAITISDASAAEGTSMRFTLTSAFASGRDLVVNLMTVNGTAAAPADFAALSGATATISSGQTITTFDLPISADNTDEPNESFVLRATFEGVSDDGTGTITDADVPSGLRVVDLSIDEGDSGNTSVAVTVNLVPASGQAVSVNYATSNGSAQAGSDYVAATGTVSFAPGETSKTFPVTVLGDETPEASETFLATLSNATNASIADGTATITIDNDDGAFFAAEQITTGAGAGAGAHVRVFDAAGSPQPPEGFFPYRDGPGVRVARGDLDGDGHDELVVAPGPGNPSIVQVFTPNGSALIDQVDAYPGFTGGVFIAVGDVDGDGNDDVITAPGAGGGPHVRTFKLAVSGSNRTLSGAPGFFATRAEFTGGLTVASGDVNDDNIDEIILGVASGDQPIVFVWDYNPSTGVATQRSAPFLAYVAQFLGGIYVAAGDLDGDGKAEIITGAGRGGGPHVRVFTGNGGGLPGSAYAYAAEFTGGVLVAVGDVDGNGVNEIITAAGPGGGPHVRTFDLNMKPGATSFYAYGPQFGGGVFLAAGRP